MRYLCALLSLGLSVLSVAPSFAAPKPSLTVSPSPVQACSWVDVDAAGSLQGEIELRVYGQRDPSTSLWASSPVFANDDFKLHERFRASGQWNWTNSSEGASFKVALYSDGAEIVSRPLVILGDSDNVSPNAQDAFMETDEDVALLGYFPAVDVDGDELTYWPVSLPTNGNFAWDEKTGAFTFTPDANWYGTTSIVYAVADCYHEAYATVFITVLPVNDAPNAEDVMLSGQEDVAVSGTLVASDIDGDVLTFHLVESDTDGLVEVTNTGALSFYPAPNWFGSAHFRYEAFDGQLASPPATIAVVLAPVNDPPVALPLFAATLEDTALSGLLSGRDVEADSLIFTLVDGPNNGNVVLDASGAYLFNAEPNWHGSTSFTFRVSDGSLISNVETAHLTVEPVNDPPEVSSTFVTGPSNLPVTGNVIASDIDGDVLTYRVHLQSQDGTATVDASNGRFVFNAKPGFHGVTNFQVGVGDGIVERYATVIIDVRAAGGVEEFVAPDIHLSIPMGGMHVMPLAAYPGFRPVMLAQSELGDAIIDSLGYLTVYAYDVTGVATFSYRYEAKGVASKPGLIVASLLPIDSAATVKDAFWTTGVNQPVQGTLYGRDPNGDSVSYEIVTAPTQGTVIFTTCGYCVKYTPANDYSGGDVFTYRVHSGGKYSSLAVVRISIRSSNVAPVAPDLELQADEDQQIEFRLSANDADGDPLSYQINSLNVRSAISGEPDAFLFLPSQDSSGVARFWYRAFDGRSYSNLAYITVNVRSINDAPRIGLQRMEGESGEILVGELDGYDPEGDPISYSMVMPPAHGELNLDQNSGHVEFRPTDGWEGESYFIVEAKDATNATQKKIPVVVGPGIVAQDFSGSVLTGQKLIATLQASGVNGSGLRFYPETLPKSGDLERFDVYTGRFTFRAYSSPGSDAFTVIADDGRRTKRIIVSINILDGFTATAFQGVNYPINLPKPSSIKVASVIESDSDLSAVIVNKTAYVSLQRIEPFSGSRFFKYRWVDLSNVSHDKVVEVRYSNRSPISIDAHFHIYGQQFEGVLPAHDPDGNLVRYRLVAPSDAGSVVIDEMQGTFKFQAPGNFVGTTTFVYAASDGELESTGAITLESVPFDGLSPVAEDLYFESAVNAYSDASLLAFDEQGFNIMFAETSSSLNDPYVIAQIDDWAGVTYSPRSSYYAGTTSFDYQAISNGITVTRKIYVGVTPRPRDLPPIARDVVIQGEEDTEWWGKRAVGTDPNARPVTFRALTKPPAEFLSFDSDGYIRFVPPKEFSGDLSFLYELSDGVLVSKPARVTLRVLPVNDRPLVVYAAYSLPSSESSISGLLEASDVEGDPLTFEALQSVGGNVTIDAHSGAFTFERDIGRTSDSFFAYRVNDGKAYSEQALVSVVSRALPQAFDVTYVGLEDGEIRGKLSAVDPDGEPLTYVQVTKPEVGSVNFDSASGAFVFRPPLDWNGKVAFTYRVTNGRDLSALAEVSITIHPTVDPACVLDQTHELQGGNLASGRLYASNPDEQPGQFSIVRPTVDGLFTLNTNGAYSFAPNDQFFGETEVVVDATDPYLANSSALVTFVVKQAIPASTPFSADAFFKGESNQIISEYLPLSGTSRNPSFKLLQEPAHGTLSVESATGKFTFTPDYRWYGQTEFRFRASFTDGTETNTGTVRIRIDPPRPAAKSASFGNFELNAFGGAIFADSQFSANLSGTDPFGIPLRFSLACSPTPEGKVSVNDVTGTFQFTPSAGFYGETGFAYRVDNGFSWSTTAYVQVFVSPKVPTADALSFVGQVGEGVFGVLSGSDPQQLPLRYLLSSSQPSVGTVSINPQTGVFAFVPNIAGWQGQTSFRYTVTNGFTESAAATVTLMVGNTAGFSSPVALDVIDTLDEYSYKGFPNSGRMVGYDPNGRALTYQVVSTEPEINITTLLASGHFAYTLPQWFSGVASLTYQAFNGTEYSNLATYTVVRPAIGAFAPIFNPATILVSVKEDTLYTGQLSAFDMQGDPVYYFDMDTYNLIASVYYGLVYGYDSLPSGEISVNRTGGHFSAMPPPDWNGVWEFDVLAPDSGSACCSAPLVGKAKVVLTVEPVNDPPIAEAAYIAGQEGEGLSGLVTGYDVDGDDLTYELVEPPLVGSLTWDAAGIFSYMPLPGWYGTVQFSFRAFDGELASEIQTATLHLLPGSIQVLPPDPSSIAPPLPCCTAPDFLSSIEFLFKGNNVVQFGVADGIITKARAALIRGRVLDGDGLPLPGARIAIADHPEYGFTLSRIDGAFDLALNGGGEVLLQYDKGGYVPVHRVVSPGWLDSLVADDVVLTPLDGKASAIGFPGISTQVHTSSIIADANGSRKTTLLFRSGTTARAHTLSGETFELSGTLHVRSTEVTIGEKVLERMPAVSPAGRATLFGAEFTLDEAISPFIDRVDFNKPVVAYIDNYLGLPNGAALPVGYYERKGVKSGWLAEPNGRVIRVLGEANGQAVLDTNGDDIPESAPGLTLLGIDTEELQEMALIFEPGDTLWRMSLRHFSFLQIAAFADYLQYAVDWTRLHKLDDPLHSSGNSAGVNVVDQSIVRRIPISGTPFSLEYDSKNAPGALYRRTRVVHLTGQQLPLGLSKVSFDAEIGGKKTHFETNGTPSPGAKITFAWDGKDAYGRVVNGLSRLDAKLTNDYTFRVYLPYPEDAFLFDSALESFSDMPNFSATTTATLMPTSRFASVKVSAEQTAWVENWSTPVDDLGGWNLDIKKLYEPATQTLRDGAGTALRAEQVGSAILAIAGSGQAVYNGEHISALEGAIDPADIVVRPDGSVVFADFANNLVRQLTTEGQVSTIAGRYLGGNTEIPSAPSSMSALNAALESPAYLALGRDDALYIGEERGRILILSPTGQLSVVTDLEKIVGGLAVDSEQRLLIATPRNNQIIRLERNGEIKVIAGTGIGKFNEPDGVPAVSANIITPVGVEVTSNGEIYFAEAAGGLVRRIDPDGRLHTIMGGGVGCHSITTGSEADFGQGYDNVQIQALICSTSRGVGAGKARNLSVGTPAIVRGAGDRLYVSATDPFDSLQLLGSSCISWGFCPSLSLVQIAEYAQMFVPLPHELRGGAATLYTINSDGNARSKVGAEPGAAPAEEGGIPFAVGHNGFLYFAKANRIWKMGPAMPGLTGIGASVTSGSSISQFDGNGLHLSTRDRETNVRVVEFDHDGDGRLLGLRDQLGRYTRIERNGAGQLTGIVSPDNRRIEFTLDPAGRIASASADTGLHTEYLYDLAGLLVSYVDPLGGKQKYTYTLDGRLLSVVGPDELAGTLGRSAEANSLEEILDAGGRPFSTFVTDGAGRMSRISLSDDWLNPVIGGTFSRTSRTNAAGNQSDWFESTGHAQGFLASGTEIDVQRILGADLAPQPSALNLAFPGAFATSVKVEKSSRDSKKINDYVISDLRHWHEEYDMSTAERRTTSPMGRQSYALFDSVGRVVAAQNGTLAPKYYTYGPQGYLATATVGDASNYRVTKYDYDARGRLVAVTDPMGLQQNYAYGSNDQLSSITRPDGNVVAFEYDVVGNLRSLTPPSRPAHLFDYSISGQRTSYNAPDGQPIVYSYEPRTGELSSVLRPDGTLLAYSRDNGGRLYSVGTAGAEATYSYWPTSGQLKSIVSGVTSLDHYYAGDLLNKVTTTTPYFTAAVMLTRNQFFEVINEQVQVGYTTNTVNFAFDQDSLTTAAGYMTVKRDASNGLVEQTLISAVTGYEAYNTFGELMGTSTKVDANQYYTASYVRDGAGRIVTKTEGVLGAVVSQQFHYDPAGRLTGVDLNGQPYLTYEYDENGNRLRRISAVETIDGEYDNQDRVLRFGPFHYSYTPNGEVATKWNQATLQTWSYSYNGFGTLTRVDTPSKRLDYVIDGKQRRVAKLSNGSFVEGYVYRNDLQLIADIGPTRALRNRYVYATGRRVPDYFTRSDGKIYRLITDYLGSVRLVVVATTGAVVQQIDYDEFGNVTLDTNPGFQPFGFAGGLYDPDTGLVHFGARDYDPYTGRWTSKDPILFQGGDTNLYGYVLNDPINGVDPSGLSGMEGTHPASVTLLNDCAIGGLSAPSLDTLRNCQRTSSHSINGTGDYSAANQVAGSSPVPYGGAIVAGAGVVAAGAAVAAVAPEAASGAAAWCLSNPVNCNEQGLDFVNNLGDLGNASGPPMPPTSKGGFLGFLLGQSGESDE